MARGFSPYYSQDGQLGATIGASLGKALFGDPEAAAKLAMQRAQLNNYNAQAEEAKAHAGLYTGQAEGVGIQNGASRSLPDLIASMFTQPEATAPVDPAGTSTPYYSGGFDPVALRAGLPAAMAAMAQMKGDKVDPNAIIGGLTAMLGDDEFARRGMVAQGHTPGKDFALTPERADDISGRDAGETLRQALSLEGIRSTDRRRGQDISATTQRRGQDLTDTRGRRGQDLSHEDRVAGRETKFIPLGERMITDVLPGARISSGERTPKHNREVGGVSDSYHLPGDGVETYDMEPMGSFADAKARMAAKYGSRLVEAIDETNRPGHGPHWHFAVAQERAATGKGAGSTAKAKTPKAISTASQRLLDGELEKQLEGSGLNLATGARANIRASIANDFQRTGNAVESVKSVLGKVRQRLAGGGQPKPAAKPAQGKPGADQLRQQALNAIGKGADPEAVRARFKQMTGQDLKGV